MKFLMTIATIFLFSNNIFADEARCGKLSGFSYNKDSIERPYRLSGFFVKQNTKDVRVTFGKSPELIEDIEILLEDSHNIFVCMDSYDLYPEMRAGKIRVYGAVYEYRIWVDGARTR